MERSFLAIEQLRVSYGGIKALRGISLHVSKGEIVSIIGANGAGKTTLLKTIVRLLPMEEGSIFYKNESIQKQSTEDLVQLGISLVPEGRGIFSGLTVRENLELGAWKHKNQTQMEEVELEIFKLFPRLKERFKQEAGTLSGGEQQMLAVGRAMMAKPELLLLDEPSLGIAPKLVIDIFEAIAKIAAHGTTILLVEQNTRLALKYSGRAYVMKVGEVALSGSAKDLLENPEVKSLYLGG